MSWYHIIPQAELQVFVPLSSTKCYHQFVYDDVMHGNVFRIIDHLWGESTGESPHKWSVMRTFNIYTGVSLNNSRTNSRMAGDLRRQRRHDAYVTSLSS